MFNPSEQTRQDTALILNINGPISSQDWEIEVGSVELINEISRSDLVNIILSNDLESSLEDVLACAFLVLLSSIDEALQLEDWFLDKLIDALSTFIDTMEVYGVFLKADMKEEFEYWIGYFSHPDNVNLRYQVGSHVVANMLREFLPLTYS